jgi:DNA polymerase sigma
MALQIIIFGHFFRDYFLLDPRVRTLSTALRLWAKLCIIDRQQAGTLPAHAFPILLVYFLQQGKKPILPCIHDHLSSREPEVYECKKRVEPLSFRPNGRLLYK